MWYNFYRQGSFPRNYLTMQFNKKPAPPPTEFPYKYPSFRRVRLAAVKDGIYNPSLPTLRMMDSDSASHKMPDDHCQTSTLFGTKTYQQQVKDLRRMPRRGTTDGVSFRLQPKPVPKSKIPNNPDANQFLFNVTLDEWKKYAEIPYRFRLPVYDPKHYRFKNNVIRYIEEDLTPPSRYILRQEPSLYGFVQSPLPADINSRYRDLSPRYRRNNISTLTWY